MTDLTLKLTPRRAGLKLGVDNELDVLVQLQAPDAPEELDRAPLNVAFVVDRSGSMRGRPLFEAKRCVEQMVDRLFPKDRAALVTYDHLIDVPVQSTPLVDKERFKEALAEVYARGRTDLHQGWWSGGKRSSPLHRP